VRDGLHLKGREATFGGGTGAPAPGMISRLRVVCEQKVVGAIEQPPGESPGSDRLEPSARATLAEAACAAGRPLHVDYG
jgi:hypothetical protein